MLFARAGFNVIATANTRDRGVNEMSAALKRRFNFETVPPDRRDLTQEMDAGPARDRPASWSAPGCRSPLPPEITELLVTTFRELRQGKTADGKGIEPLSAVLSTAEAVSHGYAAGIHAYYYGDGDVTPEHLVQHLVGTVLKDNPDDLKKLQHYFDHVVKGRRAATGGTSMTLAAISADIAEAEIRPLLDRLCDTKAEVVFFPVRHHSPAGAALVGT